MARVNRKVLFKKKDLILCDLTYKLRKSLLEVENDHI